MDYQHLVGYVYAFPEEFRCVVSMYQKLRPATLLLHGQSDLKEALIRT